MHRYIQIGIHVKGFFSKKYNRFQREITQVVEFYVDDDTNEAKVNVLYARDLMENEVYNNPTSHLIDYLASQGVMMQEDPFIPKGSELQEASDDNNNSNETGSTTEISNTTNTEVTTNEVDISNATTTEVTSVTPVVASEPVSEVNTAPQGAVEEPVSIEQVAVAEPIDVKTEVQPIVSEPEEEKLVIEEPVVNQTTNNIEMVEI